MIASEQFGRCHASEDNVMSQAIDLVDEVRCSIPGSSKSEWIATESPSNSSDVTSSNRNSPLGSPRSVTLISHMLFLTGYNRCGAKKRCKALLDACDFSQDLPACVVR